MIPKTDNDILNWVKEFVEREGIVPSTDHIYGAAQFRQAGGIGRLLSALQALAETHLHAVRFPQAPARIDAIINQIFADHGSKGPDDDGISLVCASRVELRRSLAKVIR